MIKPRIAYRAVLSVVECCFYYCWKIISLWFSVRWIFFQDKKKCLILLYSVFPQIKVTFEDKKRENFERGNLELEKRRQALLEQQRKEQERLAQLERAEQERKERERQEQERKRQLELEKQLEKQRELERQREEERRKEIERREVTG